MLNVKNLINRIFRHVAVFVLALLVFVGGLYLEGRASVAAVAQQENAVLIQLEGNGSIGAVRNGQEKILKNDDKLLVGDLVKTAEDQVAILSFAENGIIRLDKNSSLVLTGADVEAKQFVFRIISGRIWLNNLYSNAAVNILTDNGVIMPEQSVSYYQLDGDKVSIYANTNNLEIGFVEKDFFTNKPLSPAEKNNFLNSLLLPQGTQIYLFKNKINGKEDTIKKLLYSKLIKEFQYSIFDLNQFKNDSWLKDNLQQDSDLGVDIKNNRLDAIAALGKRLHPTEGWQFQLNGALEKIGAILTFSKEKVAQRELVNALSFLDDSEYLYSVGRTKEGLSSFQIYQNKVANLITDYGFQFKKLVDQKLIERLGYLSFVTPGDSLYELKGKLNADFQLSLRGSGQELEQSFRSLSEKLNVLNYYAATKDFKLLQAAFNDYFTQFKTLIEQNKDVLAVNVLAMQKQIQLLDNLFLQYPEFYRVDFFKALLLVENQYLSLWIIGSDKYEEMQTVISQRIDFLRRLQTFFLDGQVPLDDAKNIVALLITEIGKLELPSDLRSGVTKLFNQRLADFAIFNRFLNSSEYVSSPFKGKTYSDRFEAFKVDLKETVVAEELLSKTALEGNLAPTTESPQPKVPRVKP